MEQQTLDTVEEAYEALFHNDIPTLLDMLADGVDWLMPGPPNILSYAGPRRGRLQVAAFFEALHENEEVELFRAKEFIAGENKIIVLGDYRARVKLTGQMISLQWAHVLTTCHGKIDRWRGYFDTAAVVAAHTRTAAQKVASAGSPGRGWGVSRLL
jgi:ketosteroid isomerase-like protein